ncbi:46dbb565-3d69-48cd-bf48-4d3fdd6f2649 [Sclerotinia trifoliorum]|uniref:46dbb565-3d69-48cd-bf48-4d3fdd6f2649 n=1 Tax=Sclerotinia trifoliorum TaxID=28548 RepID=A0A8H2ZTT4_9HELO|nr:46dbb565-3d69-48cd-bf48-4d3fdd6f2649 [Sclerotinia trifoliorum]
MIPSFMDSPKRKRNNLQAPTPPDSSPVRLETSMNFPTITPDEAGQGSPRTKVAYHFQGLALDGPTDIKKLDLKKKAQETTNAESVARKRVKMFASKDVDMTGNTIMEIPETPQTKIFRPAIGDERKVDPIIREMGNNVRLYNELDPVIFRAGLNGREGRDDLARPYPSINRLADSKSRKKRMGTPPLSRPDDAMGETREVLDPDRASLTWHDDEITGHKPDDPDDDGEGINGIGFRPTPAIAYARAERRKQQMAGYRSREAREARARRSERRRGTEAAAREEAENVARRVRFLESDTQTIISTS